MLEEQGVVVAIDGASCIVELGVSQACGACRAPCSIGASPSVRRLSAPIPDRFDVKPGDRVLIGIAGPKTLLAMSVLYVGPLLSLFAGGFIGLLANRFLWHQAGDVATLIGAGVAFASHLMAMKKWGVLDSLAATPVICRRLET
jgi:positive regulator of sigma E activity